MHARTTQGCAIDADIDADTGEIVRRKLSASAPEIVAWGASLPGPQIATYDDGAAWTAKHDRWLREHRDRSDASFTTAFDAYYKAVTQTVARRDRLDWTASTRSSSRSPPTRPTAAVRSAARIPVAPLSVARVLVARFSVVCFFVVWLVLVVVLRGGVAVGCRSSGVG